MDKTRLLVFASVVAAAMVFGGVLGATVLARVAFTPAAAAAAAASPSPTPKSNEAAAHEAGESSAREAAENNGTAFGPGGPGGGPSNETSAHEANESAAQEAAEKT